MRRVPVDRGTYGEGGPGSLALLTTNIGGGSNKRPICGTAGYFNRDQEWNRKVRNAGVPNEFRTIEEVRKEKS